MIREHREALVVGHPGHELRVDGWLTLAKPLSFVLTDGSGATGAGRIASTEAILREAGAIRGSVFGTLTDRAAYEPEYRVPRSPLPDGDSADKLLHEAAGSM